MKLKELYLDNGYLDMRKVINLPYPFIFVVGGRGTGKTFGALTTCVEDNLIFGYVRRTQTQADVIKSESMSPFKSVNRLNGWDIVPYRTAKYVHGFFDTFVDEEGNKRIDPEKLKGYAFALSTFSNLRSFDASDINIILYDEFIPQVSERALTNESDSFFNMVETINRNRELNGDDPTKVLCMANASDIANPYFMSLGLVTKLMSVKSAGEFIWTDEKRGICVIFPKSSKISEEKKDTALYKMTEGTQFYANSIENDFVYNHPTAVHSSPLIEYKLMVSVGELHVYKHKAKREFYISTHKTGTAPAYGCSPKELKIFQHRYPYLRSALFGNILTYENYACEVLFDKYTEMW